MDQCWRGLMNEGRIRVLLADTSKTSAEICKRHGTSPVASDALSRLLSIGAILGILQKYGKVSLRVEANGPLKLMLVDANEDGEIRGFVANPQVNLPLKENGKLDVAAAVGDLGVITVIKHLGMKQNFSSQVVLQSGEIGDDFSYYFLTSEQTPSIVAVGSSIRNDGEIMSSGALLVQLMPDAREEDIHFAEEFAKQLPSITTLLSEGGIDALKRLLPNLEVLETHPIQFACTCSKERFVASIATLHESEIIEMIEDKKNTEVTCEFCHSHYELSVDDLKQSLAIKKSNQKSAN